jgi:hypothetical protein
VILWIKGYSESLATSMMVVALAGVAIANATGRAVPNTNWIAAGVVGMLLGRVCLGALDNVLLAAGWKLVGILLLGYGVVVLMNVDDLASQLAVTVAWLLVLYTIGRVMATAGKWVEGIWLLGRYSLLAYIAQIAYLQGTPLFLSVFPENEMLRAVLLMSVIALLTWGTVAAVDFVRRRVAGVDRLYRFVFA